MSELISQDGDMVSAMIAAITKHIGDNGLTAGDRMPSEAHFAERHGASRTVVREAFRSLAALQLIELSAGKRAAVAAPKGEPVGQMFEHGVRIDEISIQEIYDVRRTIEVRTASLAALRRTDAEGRKILHHATMMEAHFSDPEAGMEHDIAFHQLIAMASRNKVFEMLVSAFEGITRDTWPIGWRSRKSDDERLAMIQLHIDLAHAIVAKDPTGSAAIMSRHFDISTRALLDAGIR
jgi:GntR family transcriptional regulator, transcriptional repressor for pyruvate dehydrogenase complex